MNIKEWERSVLCPTCGAKPGRICRITREERRKQYGYLMVHPSRIRAYRRTPEFIHYNNSVAAHRIGNMREPKPKKLKVGMGNAQGFGLRSMCVRGKHSYCVASHCTCECHKVHL